MVEGLVVFAIHYGRNFHLGSCGAEGQEQWPEG